MSSIFSRTRLLVGDKGILCYNNTTIVVVGCGGVGGEAVEMLVRAGIGKLILIDKDVVDITNINRQVIALHSTIDRPKVDVFCERILDINPECVVIPLHICYDSNNMDIFGQYKPDYVLDCIDMVTSKVVLAEYCTSNNIQILSAMGAGNRLGIGGYEIMDIFDTSYDKLAKVMRRKLRDASITKLEVICSKEESIKIEGTIIGSMSYAPTIMGATMAGYVLNKLLEKI